MQKQTSFIVILILVFGILSMSSLPGVRSTDLEVSQSSIEWYSFEEGMEKAEQSNKPVFIDFMTDYCTACQRMENETYTDQRIRNKTDEVIFIKVDAEERGDLTEKYGISVVPTLVFETPEGEEIERVNGYIGPSELLEKLNNAVTVVENPGTDPDNNETPFGGALVIISAFSIAVIITSLLYRRKRNTGNKK